MKKAAADDVGAVEEYLAAVPEPARGTLLKIRAIHPRGRAGGRHRGDQLRHACVPV